MQTLVPEVEEVQNRRPSRQVNIEMANFLRNELGKNDGGLPSKTKNKFNEENLSTRSSKKGIVWKNDTKKLATI